ncbi:arsenical pump-driving ATPase [Paenibacillus sambharensis]|uniref:Arsenical pump-driving ATPase n=1 Tax=Paenibacillus sambharensis TaxID=1803190 RepID=A0A2W1M0L2_9BACL|nr:arsenical pump-driving ATPase [Paenibacillus sambharensis]PZD97471.1 arsenical pump-driving ATPase [Paenibacillus sambharensis]
MEYTSYHPQMLKTPFLFFTGKGGVGKTSLACATAVNLAKSGKKVLIVSTDPASNLDDVFQVRLDSEPAPIADVQGLFAANLDPEEAARLYREKVVGPYRGILPDAAIANIEEQLSGACTVEIAAFDEFSKLLASTEVQDNYDHIILDTAPTGHTLRLLQLPKAWTGFLADSQHGASCLGPLSGLGEKKDLYAETVAALADPARTTLILVARPDRAALTEAARAAHELRTIGIVNQQLIVNGVLFDPGTDPAACLYHKRQAEALACMPGSLCELPLTFVGLNAAGLMGIQALETMFNMQHREPHGDRMNLSSRPQYLAPLLEQLSAKTTGVIMTMGKGGVGKTSVAAALAIGLADRGLHVHLTTTDPAAHLEFTVGEPSDQHFLTVSRIDPKHVTERYKQQVIAENASRLDEEGMALLKEDLASPCTEEIAVFRAFAEAVAKAKDGFIVLDTAPTGHTLLLLDAAEAYHREVLRSAGDVPEHVKQLLPRLRNPQETDVVVVTLPEATPVLEAERLQEDLRRAGIQPSWWVVNQSWQSVSTSHPVLAGRAYAESPWLGRVASLAEKYTVVPWKPQEPVGAEQLRGLLSDETV